MTTYSTIQEAFKNGTGDVFFTKNNQFVCFSRKDKISLSEMNEYGFSYVTYSEVIELSFKDNKVDSAIIWALAKKKELKTIASYDNISNGRDGYYDEFPDAYGQNL